MPSSDLNPIEPREAPDGRFLPVDPYRTLRVHFGMLLGVDDFETLDAYHRGKTWLHNAWLHRQGTVWGLDVKLDQEHNMLRVLPGLALDGAGRELHLERPACLDLGRWYAEHRNDTGIEIIEKEGGSVRLHAHVVIRFKSCLARQVPALLDPCDGSGTTTAYSRVFETVELELVPGLAPRRQERPGGLPYHRLRLLFGLDEPREKPAGGYTDKDQKVLDVRQRILDPAHVPVGERPANWLRALRVFTALDQVEMLPAETREGRERTLFPAADPAPVVLADLVGLALAESAGGFKVTGVDEIDVTVRSAHLPTQTIQELLCGPPCLHGTAGPVEVVEAPAAVPVDAGGPRVIPDSVELQGKALIFQVDGPLSKNSVMPAAFELASFDRNDGWISCTVQAAVYNPGQKRVAVHVKEAPSGNLVRFIARGTGAQPLLGTGAVGYAPLAGAVGGPPGGAANGHDFVTQFKQQRS